jgi:hypothetical protein
MGRSFAEIWGLKCRNETAGMGLKGMPKFKIKSRPTIRLGPQPYKQDWSEEYHQF